MELNSAQDASTRFLSIAQRSVSEDLGCRRGEFSRKHYGSVELLISSDADGAIQRAGRFRVENGSSDENADFTPGTWRRTDVHLENPEYHTRWYFKYFLGKVHQNYIGTDAEKNPFFLSVVLSNQNNQRVPQYRSILWKKTGTQKICLPYSPTKTLSVKSILSAMSLDKFEKSPREIPHPEIQKDLLVLEEQEGCVNFKFGVLYSKDGQLTDDEMFSNETGSDSFQRLLNLLGDTITLKGWTGYRGGLDTKNDTTGIYSIYTVYQGHEIMFHVSTMLPYSKENKQQVERKRHIGNDIVTIVFQEGEESSPAFKPSMIRSHFTHIFALVRYNKQNDSYRLKIFSEESVPLFGPPLPSPPVFTDHQEFRDFVLVKLINGEKATLETPTFAQKRQRTLDMLIRSLYQDLMPDLHKNMLNRRSFSDVLPESPRSARKKEEARQAEFVRLGQALKLKTIVRGDALTSSATTSLYKKEPWESQCFCSNFPHEVVCADSWGQSLLVSTDVGVLLIDDGQSSVQVFDKTLQVKQMHVLEALDLLITRADKGAHLLHSKCQSGESALTGSMKKCLIKWKRFFIWAQQLCESPESALQVNFVAAIDVYEDGEAGLLLCYNYVCYYRKVCPYNGGSPLVQTSASDFHFSWNQVPYAIVCAFPYILAFTTDSIEIRLVVNGNLVHTAVVPELQLVASRSDIYFKATATVSGSSNRSSKETSSNSSPQTPTAHEMPEFPSSSAEGEVQYKHLYKIPLSNLVGRSIERPLKSPLVPKAITMPTSSIIASAPVSHSLSLSRMEIKEIASRTRRELLGLLDEKVPKSEVAQKQKKVPRKPSDPKQGAIRSTSSDRIISNSFESSSEGRHLSTSSDPDTAANREESLPSSSPFNLTTSFDEDIIDLK
ncbi:GTPase-activating Rap/Ran-GAP domain-like protein 3 isoform 4-T6 [Macrochelys suwanniensis]